MRIFAFVTMAVLVSSLAMAQMMPENQMGGGMMGDAKTKQ
jgi:hypothetical protein